MSSVNKVILVGRLGKDPECRNLDNGAVVANFSIATSESWKDKTTGEKKTTTEWHNIVLWRGLAEIAQKYLHKGDLIYIEGKLTTRSWEKNGVKHYMTEVVGDNLVMLGGAKKDGTNVPSTSIGRDQHSDAPFGGSNVQNVSNGGSDDLPF